MKITKISDKMIINHKEVNFKIIRDIFIEFGKIVIYVTDDFQKLIGIITYGSWNKNKDNQDNWISYEFKAVYKNDAKNFINAKQIFKEYRLIGTLPVLHDDNTLFGEIINYSIDEIEKGNLEERFLELEDILLNKDMQEELSVIKKHLEGKKVILIGRNYLTDYIREEILDKCKIEEKAWIEIQENETYDFVIDMEIFPQISRLELGGYGLKNIKGIYSCQTFVYDFNIMLSLEIFTTFVRGTNNPYYTLKDVIENLNIQKIYIRNHNILLGALVKYFNENSICFCIDDDILSYIGWGNYIKVEASKSDLYPLWDIKEIVTGPFELSLLLRHSIQILEFIEARSYIQKNFQQISIYDFILDTKMEKYHSTEIERFKKNIEISDLLRENEITELEEFYGRKIESIEQIEEFTCVREIRKTSRGVIYDNRASQGRCYINGIRETIGIKKKYKNTIYCFGPCICEGYIVTDMETIESYLQSKINLNDYDYRVINLGSANVLNISKMAKSVNFQKGDIVLNFYLFMNQKVKDKINLYKIKALSEYKKEHDDVLFMDVCVHCNGKANEMISNKIFDIIDEKLTVTQNEDCLRNHSYYDVFNNDDDIEFLGNKMSEYFKYLQSKKNDEVESGAVVVNCNPFTFGHLYLIEYAAKQVKNLYVFVVEEDKSYFKFKDRYEMVKQGVSHLPNVKVLKTGKFLASETVIPGYFTREVIRDLNQDTSHITMDVSKDLRVFGKFVAPKLNITKRFVGEELHDLFTKQYNDEMKEILPMYGIEVEEIQRFRVDEKMIVSAKTVRECLKNNDCKLVKKIVPYKTYKWLFDNDYLSEK